MADIAKECGVSMMTVSRVLSGKGSVSAKTRDKVMQVARAHNFAVNSIASSFARRKSNFVGLVAPMDRIVGSDYFSQIWKGVNDALKVTNYDLALFDYHSSEFAGGARVQSLYHSRKVDGILCVTPTAEDAFLDTTHDQRIPLVVLGKPVNNPQICTVNCEDYQGVIDMAEYLYNQGHRRIAFLGGPKDWSLAQLRVDAFKDFCQRRRLRVPKRFIAHSEYTPESSYEAGLRLLEVPHRPTAIIAGNDISALGIIKGAHTLGLRVPEDLSVAGSNDYHYASNTEPPLTAIHQPLRDMAKLGTRTLLDALDRNEPPTGHLAVKTSLSIRQSTGPVPR